MKKAIIGVLLLTIAVTGFIAAKATAEIPYTICTGTVYDGGTAVSGATINCEVYHRGWCGATYYSPMTTDASGFFRMRPGPGDQAGYFAVCITYNGKWAHVLNFYSNCTTGINLGDINLNTGIHPGHASCPD